MSLRTNLSEERMGDALTWKELPQVPWFYLAEYLTPVRKPFLAGHVALHASCSQQRISGIRHVRQKPICSPRSFHSPAFLFTFLIPVEKEVKMKILSHQSFASGTPWMLSQPPRLAFHFASASPVCAQGHAVENRIEEMDVPGQES